MARLITVTLVTLTTATTLDGATSYTADYQTEAATKYDQCISD